MVETATLPNKELVQPSDCSRYDGYDEEQACKATAATDESPPDSSKGPHDPHGPDADDDDDHPTGPPSSLVLECLIVAVVCAGQLLTQAGLALSVVPLHIIGASFHITNPGQLSWFAAAYSLTVGTFILPAGRLGDLYGHRNMFVIGFAWFALWSFLGGVSVWAGDRPNGAVLFDVCRAMQGIGPAMILPNAVAMLGHMYPPSLRKAIAFSLFGATAPGGFMVGGVFCSLLAERVWWPWGYWIFAIVCLLTGALGWAVIPDNLQLRKASLATDTLGWAARVDLAGAVTGVSGLVLVNFAWNQGPVVGWSVPYTYVLLIVGLLLLVLFAFIERRAPCPLLPSSIFSRQLGFVLGCIGAGWSSFGVLIFYFYQLLEIIKGNSPLLAVAKFTGASVSGAVAAITTGIIIMKVRASFIMLIAMLAFLISLILLATLPMNQVYWAQTFVLSILAPWGMDMSFPSGTLILSNSMPREHQGLAASVVNTVVNYSISIGLGIAGTVEWRVTMHNDDLLHGYRSAIYTGVGLSGMGVVLALAFVLFEHFVTKK